ncbi:probable F-box protein At2g36090 [Cynara cardunculus var. scolymus]|uniref:F-box domain, cyclin-like protein n=1 Tax=Cynara cardunculus var. scolymus TaxID=59895 RepID=A0A103XH41_CYNCS|nr:probable F-box protein At2g36090 [Cynara cardunculus var. scolymus]KVH90599.1 F-box domain, cyclin-like protein [Cynara cardunculus var. scolymus]
MSIAAATPSRAAGISSLHTDILESHILTRLDGQTLASAGCASATIHSLSGKNHHLWSDVCHSTWPSTSGEFVNGIISTFSDDTNGPREFFSQSFPLPSPDPTNVDRDRPSSSSMSSPPSALISAVDVYHRNKLIFTKTEETETVTGWFRCSPFRIDLLDPKDMVPTQIPHPEGKDTCTALIDDMTLSWILIDPINKRAVNLSSHKPVSVQRHWLSREVQVRFVSILRGRRRGGGGDAGVVVQCGIVVNCGRSEDGEMQVREVTMEVEDMDGKHLNGRDSLVIFQRAMEAKRGNGVKREEEARRRYRRYEEMKRERRERKLRIEGTLDTLSVAFGLSIFAALFFIFC